MGITRLSKWAKEEKIPLAFAYPVDPDFDNFLKLRESSERSDYLDLFKTSFDLMKMTKELIFEIIDDVPVLHHICPLLHTNEFELSYQHLFDTIFVDDEDIEKEVVNTLGLATGLEVPVFANRKEDENELAKYYLILIKNGFTAPDDKGQDVRLIPNNAKQIDDFKIENFSRVDLTEYWSPADLMMLRNRVADEFHRLNNAHRTLSMLALAIKSLEDLLEMTSRNENSLQKCITENPILLGLEYTKTIPKHPLGSEYQVDYALEKIHGQIDLMEIESSTLNVYNKNGNPSSYLVHAEQQVLDWLDWVEKNSAYARNSLEGLLSPRGFIIIGRRSSLTDKTTASLIRRNKAFNGRIIIMTYDDILSRAKNLSKILHADKRTRE